MKPFVAVLSASLSIFAWSALANAAPEHVPIMAYVGIDGYDPGPAIVSRYVTYARAGLQLRTARSSCFPRDCTALFYVDTHNVYCDWGTQEWFQLAQSHESWFMHATDGRRRLSENSAFGRCAGEDGANRAYFANFADAGEIVYWKRFLDARIAKAVPNQCFFLDDVTNFVESPGAEIHDARSLFRYEGAEFDSYAPACLWTNGLGPGGGYFEGGVSATGARVEGAAVDGAIPLDAYTRFNRARNVLGVTFEDPIWARSDRRFRLRNVPVLVNTVSELLERTTLKYAVLDWSTDVDGRDLARVRRVHTAVLWLVSGDSPNRAVSWLDPYEGPNGSNRLGVYPEQLVVPTDPRKPMGAWRGRDGANSSACDRGGIDASARGGTADLIASCGSNDGRDAGTYVREYKQCFADGRPIGRCAAIVNEQSVPVVLRGRLEQRYAHEIDSSGGPLAGVCPEDAGCDGRLDLHPVAATNGVVVPAEDARLLAQ
jgi:hypothetical protein